MAINMQIDPKLIEMLKTASEFHGHTCPGLALGVVASKVALMNAKRAEDEELVAIVENDACGVDAIQVLTGCTFGKGNLIYKDYGKSVYTFYNRTTGKALRLSVKPETFSEKSRERQTKLFDKIRDGTANDEEIVEHNRQREERIRSILDKGENLFKIEEVEITLPEKARIFNDVICENCGEPVMATKVQGISGKKLCIPCAEKKRYDG